LYDPATRRFLAIDPIRGNIFNPQLMVAYTFVLNNPLRWIDPLGRAPLSADDIELLARDMGGIIEWNRETNVLTVSGNDHSEDFRASGNYSADKLAFLLRELLGDQFGDMSDDQWDEFVASGGAAAVIAALFSVGDIHDYFGFNQVQRQYLTLGLAQGLVNGIMGLGLSINNPNIPIPCCSSFDSMFSGFPSAFTPETQVSIIHGLFQQQIDTILQHHVGGLANHPGIIGHLAGITILIDPGHGGLDSGATGRLNGVEIRESVVVMNISLYMREILRGHGAVVYMTHGGHSTNDVVSSAFRNMQYGNPDFVMSIHLNSSIFADPHGALVYHRRNCPESVAFADAALGSLIDIGLESRWNRVSPGNWNVLVNSQVPAILVEVGFMSNEDELHFMVNNQHVIADALAGGIINHVRSGLITTSQPPTQQGTPYSAYGVTELLHVAH